MVCNPFWLVFLLLCKQICHIFKKNKMVVICSNFKVFLYFTTTGTLTSWRCKNDHHLHAFNVRLGIIDSHETCSLVIGLVSQILWADALAQNSLKKQEGSLSLSFYRYYKASTYMLWDASSTEILPLKQNHWYASSKWLLILPTKQSLDFVICSGMHLANDYIDITNETKPLVRCSEMPLSHDSLDGKTPLANGFIDACITNYLGKAPCYMQWDASKYIIL